MSESVIYETQSRVERAASSAGEFMDPTLDDSELFDLVSANADLLVVPSWVGVEIPLGAAMHMYTAKINHENIGSLTAEVRSLIAISRNKAEETQEEEPDQEEQAEQKEESLQEEAELEQLEPKKEEAPQSQETQPAHDQAPPPEAKEPAAEAPMTIAQQTEPEEVAHIETSEPTLEKSQPTSQTQPEQTAAPKAETVIQSIPESTIKSGAEPTSKDLTAEPNAPASPRPESAASHAEISQPTETKPKSENQVELGLEDSLKIEQASVEPDFITPPNQDKVELSEDSLAVGVDQEDNMKIRDAELVTAETLDDQLVEVERQEPDLFEVETEESESEEEPKLIASENEVETEQTLYELPAEVDFIGPQEFLAVELPKPVEPEEPLRFEELEETESLLTTLVERLEEADEPLSEAADEILDDITQVITSLELDDEEDEAEALSEADAAQEIEELFTKLFEELDIDYEPEQLETLARLAVRWRAADEIRHLKDSQDTDELPTPSGTHEIINGVLVSLKNAKALAQAYWVGRSAVILFSFGMIA